MGPEQAISSNQARLSEEGLGHQFSHKTFGLQFVLLIKCAGVKMSQKLWNCGRVEDPYLERELTLTFLRARTQRWDAPEA